MISLLLAVAALQPAPADPVGIAAETFSGCLRSKVMAVAATITPEAGADSAWKACETERAALEQAVDTAIASAPPEVQAKVRAEYQESMAQGRAGMAQAIRSMRDAKAK